MKVNTKIALLVFMALSCIFWAIDEFALFHEIKYRSFESGNLSTLVPSGWKTTISDKRSWKIHEFTAKDAWFRISWTLNNDLPKEKIEGFFKKLRQKSFYPLKIYEDGDFILVTKGFTYRRFIVAFSKDGRIFWFESGAAKIPQKAVKDILDTALLNLCVNGAKPRPRLALHLEEINRRLLWKYMQSRKIYQNIMLAISLAVPLLIIGFSRLGGRGVKPSKLQGEVIVREATHCHVMVKTFAGTKINSCSVYLTDRRLVAFSLLRKVAEVDHRTDLAEEIKTGYSRFVGSEYLQISIRRAIGITYRFYLPDVMIWKMELMRLRQEAGIRKTPPSPQAQVAEHLPALEEEEETWPSDY